FRGKPGDPYRRPPQVAPYHLRLDWLMWFVALSPAYGRRWLPTLAAKLLAADHTTLKLLRDDPFDGASPTVLRIRLYRYRYTTRDERRETGAWWHREPLGTVLTESTLSGDGELVPEGELRDGEAGKEAQPMGSVSPPTVKATASRTATRTSVGRLVLE